MVDVAERLRVVRQRLLTQARDQIDAGDYRDQLRAYQEIINDHLKLSIELAEMVEGALVPPVDHLPLD